jgi:RHS repeat-associated protein
VEEYTPAGTVAVVYVHGRDLIAQVRGGAVSYVLVDGLGSTRALADQAGAVTDRYWFDAYGRTIGQFGVTGVDHLFAGERFDPNTGFYYLRARHYDPAAGRFASTDPFGGILQDPVTLHRYLYGNADPVNHTDPSGMMTLLEMMGVSAGVAILAGVGAYIGTQDLNLAIAVACTAGAVTLGGLVLFELAGPAIWVEIRGSVVRVQPQQTPGSIRVTDGARRGVQARSGRYKQSAGGLVFAYLTGGEEALANEKNAILSGPDGQDELEYLRFILEIAAALNAAHPLMGPATAATLSAL